MNYSLNNLMKDMEKITSKYLLDHERLINELSKNNEFLNNKITELEQQLKLSQLLNENLKLKLESIIVNGKNCENCIENQVTKPLNMTKLFKNYIGTPKAIGKENRFFENNNQLINSSIENSKILNRFSNSLTPPLTNIDSNCTLINQISSCNKFSLGLDNYTNEIGEDKEDLLNDDESSGCDLEEQTSKSAYGMTVPFKYQDNIAVRKQSERKALPGFDCFECRQYYEDLGETPSEINARIQKCSKHRSRFERPTTPDRFWDIEIQRIDTEKPVEKMKLKTRRAKPMQMPKREWKR